MTPPRPVLVDAFWKLVLPLYGASRPCEICNVETALFLWGQIGHYACRACSLKRLLRLSQDSRSQAFKGYLIGNGPCPLCGKPYNKRKLTNVPGNFKAPPGQTHFHRVCIRSVLEYEGLDVLVAIA